MIAGVGSRAIWLAEGFQVVPATVAGAATLQRPFAYDEEDACEAAVIAIGRRVYGP